MKKVIITIIVILLCIVAALALFLYMNMKDFNVLETGNLTEDVSVIKGKIGNMYLVKGDDGKYIAIDTADDSDAVKAGLDTLDIDPDDVIVVYLTHSDTDHILGLPLFKNAVVLVSDEEVPSIEGMEARKKFGKGKVDIGRYQTVSDGEELDIGGVHVEAIDTPGHTYGSASYIVNGKYIFTGDTLGLVKGKAKVFAWMYNVDDKLEATSISNIAKQTGIQYIFTGHNGYTDNFDNAMKEWR